MTAVVGVLRIVRSCRALGRLKERGALTPAVAASIQDFGSSLLSDSMMDVNRAFGRVARATYTTLPWHSGDKTIASELKVILENAAIQIEELARKKSG